MHSALPRRGGSGDAARATDGSRLGLSRRPAAVCAEACEACAEECEQFDHEHCRVCADVLPECAESCRNMAS
ncbi:hypothetical protein C477_00860 [Haloterrigena salina JCM 13891]|uniref:Four-helix bundle copper-binding protein n=1 Tax=Haloterrigena salina JCM 13891 TaxID=1227488 RepID=M0CQ04_9EURY|nr:hypothetical protein C477_00860 [Haloterrigena salina JCM 13891]